MNSNLFKINSADSTDTQTHTGSQIKGSRQRHFLHQ